MKTEKILLLRRTKYKVEMKGTEFDNNFNLKKFFSNKTCPAELKVPQGIMTQYMIKISQDILWIKDTIYKTGVVVFRQTLCQKPKAFNSIPLHEIKLLKMKSL